MIIQFKESFIKLSYGTLQSFTILSVANALSKPVFIIGFVKCALCKSRLKCSSGSLARLSTLS